MCMSCNNTGVIDVIDEYIPSWWQEGDDESLIEYRVVGQRPCRTCKPKEWDEAVNAYFDECAGALLAY